MNYNPIYIILGTAILFFLSYVVVLALSIAFMKLVVKPKEIDFGMLILRSGAFSTGWLLAMALSIWVAGSVNVWAFGLVSLMILFVFFYFLSGRLLGLGRKHQMVFAGILALILNPTWFVLLGGLK